MRKILLNSLFVSPALLGAALLSSSAIAAEQSMATTPSVDSLAQVNSYSLEGKGSNSLEQVTSVSQLSDVRPTDWAFQSLQSLVERYGCIAGYPDRTFRGNRAMTRFEFAAGLNACINRVNELITASTADLAKKEDLATLQKLESQFAKELATLRGKVTALETRTTKLEKQQFSTTTKLSGEVVFAATGEFGVKNSGTGKNIAFQDRVRLAFNTSFNGDDLLVTRLAAGNAGTFKLQNATKTAGAPGAEGIQTFNFGNTGENKVYADWIAYYFSLNSKVRVYVPAVSGLHYDIVPTVSPALDAFDGATGPLSVFAQRNPIYLIGGGSGLGTNIQLNKAVQVSATYLADNADGTQATFAANSPANKAGLFNGSYAALGQITFTPSDALQLGLTYVSAYRKAAIFDGGSGVASSGTSLANSASTLAGKAAAAQVSGYGAEVAFKVSPKLILNGFGSLISANFVDDGAGKKDILTYGVGVALPDFGKKGNLLGFTAGVEPYVTNPGAGVRKDAPLHIEGFYKYQLSDNISITPGVIWVKNPGQDKNNDDVVIGTVRTTFTF